MLTITTHWESLLEALFYAIIIVGKDGDIVSSNQAASRLLYYPKDELHGMNVEELIPENLREAHKIHRERFLENPVPRMMSDRALTFLRKDGKEVSAFISLGPLIVDQGVFTVVQLWRQNG